MAYTLEKLQQILSIFDLKLTQTEEGYEIKEELKNGHGTSTYKSLDEVSTWWSGFFSCAIKCQELEGMGKRIDELRALHIGWYPPLTEKERNARMDALFTVVKKNYYLMPEEQLLELKPMLYTVVCKKDNTQQTLFVVSGVEERLYENRHGDEPQYGLSSHLVDIGEDYIILDSTPVTTVDKIHEVFPKELMLQELEASRKAY